MQTTIYSRKPLMVEAVQVTEENLYDVAKWCGGDVQTQGNKKIIFVKVLHPLHAKQSRASVTDWVLKSSQGYKIYADTAFRKGFEEFAEDDQRMAEMGQMLRNKLANVNAAELQFQTPVPLETEVVLPPAMDTI